MTFLLGIAIGLAIASLGVVCYIEGKTKGLSIGYNKGYENGLRDARKDPA